MKLSGRQAADFCRSPDPELACVLLHGPDEGAVAARRRELVGSLLGPGAERSGVERLDAAVVRRDPAALDAALRTRGFFARRGIVLVEGGTDTLTDILESLLGDFASGESVLIVTAGNLPARSTLRTLFEAGEQWIALQISTDPLGADEIEARLVALGHSAGLSEEARSALEALSSGMDTSAFERFLETLATYCLGPNQKLQAEDVLALAPSSMDAEIDLFVRAVASGRADEVGPLIRRVTAAGATPVALLIGMQRHFRHLLLAASAQGGPEAGMGRIRPPIWGARRDEMRAQLGLWRRDRLETAARLLLEVDGRARSAEQVPVSALVERCALRLAMMAGR